MSDQPPDRKSKLKGPLGSAWSKGKAAMNTPAKQAANLLKTIATNPALLASFAAIGLAAGAVGAVTAQRANARLDATQKRLAAVEARPVGDVKKADLESVAAQLAALQSQVAALPPPVDPTARLGVADVSKRLAALAAQVTLIGARPVETSRITSLTADVTALAAEVKAIPTTDAVARAQIASVGTRLDDVAAMLPLVASTASTALGQAHAANEAAAKAQGSADSANAAVTTAKSVADGAQARANDAELYVPILRSFPTVVFTVPRTGDEKALGEFDLKAGSYRLESVFSLSPVTSAGNFQYKLREVKAGGSYGEGADFQPAAGGAQVIRLAFATFSHDVHVRYLIRCNSGTPYVHTFGGNLLFHGKAKLP